MKTYDKVYRSDAGPGWKSFQLANGYIATTEILFEKEAVVARITAKGDVAFLDLTGQILASTTMEAQSGGKEVYTDVSCWADGGRIVLKFPIVEWIDNYPHCDGEHDRWDSKTVGYHVLTFDVGRKTFAFAREAKG